MCKTGAFSNSRAAVALVAMTFYILYIPVSSADSVEVVNGTLHATASDILFKGSAAIDPSDIYDFQWRFNGVNTCRITVVAGSITSSSCIISSFYGTHSSITADIVGLELKTDLTYTDVRYEAASVVISLYDDSNTNLIGSTTFTVNNCTDSSQGLRNTSFPAPVSCIHECKANASCIAGFKTGSIEVVCKSDATWSQDTDCIEEAVRADVALAFSIIDGVLLFAAFCGITYVKKWEGGFRDGLAVHAYWTQGFGFLLFIVGVIVFYTAGSINAEKAGDVLLGIAPPFVVASIVISFRSSCHKG